MDTNTDSEKKNISHLVQNNIDPISFFEKDESFVFAYKKTEKLASAVYIVTNLFSSDEPMKWLLRKKMVDLLSFIIGYKDISEPALADFVYNLKTKMLEIVSQLEVSSIGGLISVMNFSILKEEFSNLSRIFIVSSTTPKESSYGAIPKTFFDLSQGESLING